MSKNNLILLIVPVALLTACSTTSQQILNTAAIADGGSTYIAIDKYNATEANPILPSSAVGSAGVSTLIKIGVPALVKKLGSNSTCKFIYRSMVGSGVTGATSNIANLNGVPFKSALSLGIVGGISASLSTHKYAQQYCTKQ